MPPFTEITPLVESTMGYRLKNWHWILLATAMAGCGDASFDSAGSKAPASEAPAAVSSQYAKPGGGENSSEATSNEEGIGDDEGKSASATPRRVIYTASMELVVVEDYSGLEDGIPKLAKSHGGYISETSIDRRQGRRGHGRWTARIPVEQYEKFLASVSKLGYVEDLDQSAQDVTEQYLDLEKRIANAGVLEKRILALLEKKADHIQAVLEAERELARVRTSIETMEGQFRGLKDRIALSTITISAHEAYTPPQAASFAGRISMAWNGSLEAMRQLGENCVIGVVAFVPWLIPLAIATILLVIVIRFLIRSARNRFTA